MSKITIICSQCGETRVSRPYLALGSRCPRCGRRAGIGDLSLSFRYRPASASLARETACVRACLGMRPDEPVTLALIVAHLRHRHTNWEQTLSLLPREAGTESEEYYVLKLAYTRFLSARFFPNERAFQIAIADQARGLVEKIQTASAATAASHTH